MGENVVFEFVHFAEGLGAAIVLADDCLLVPLAGRVELNLHFKPSLHISLFTQGSSWLLHLVLVFTVVSCKHLARLLMLLQRN